MRREAEVKACATVRGQQQHRCILLLNRPFRSTENPVMSHEQNKSEKNKTDRIHENKSDSLDGVQSCSDNRRAVAATLVQQRYCVSVHSSMEGHRLTGWLTVVATDITTGTTVYHYCYYCPLRHQYKQRIKRLTYLRESFSRPSGLHTVPT